MDLVTDATEAFDHRLEFFQGSFERHRAVIG